MLYRFPMLSRKKIRKQKGGPRNSITPSSLTVVDVGRTNNISIAFTDEYANVERQGPVVSVAEYRKLLDDNVSSDEVVRQRLQYFEILFRHMIREELRTYGHA